MQIARCGSKRIFGSRENPAWTIVVSRAACSSREIAMTWFAASGRTFRFALVVASATAGVCWVDSGLAAQGPGTGPGTAGGLTQLAMPIIVYGSSALVIVAGLIGAERGRHGALSPSHQEYRKRPHAK